MNRNTVPGDKSALRPSGIRIGTPALTSRNFFEKDMEKVVDFIIDAIELSIEVSASLEKTTLKQYKEALALAEWQTKMEAVRRRVEEFALTFPMPGPPPVVWFEQYILMIIFFNIWDYRIGNFSPIHIFSIFHCIGKSNYINPGIWKTCWGKS